MEPLNSNRMLQELEKDALRYRWLRSHHLQLGPDCWIRSGEDLDEAIDAEMQADSAEGGTYGKT